MSDRKAWEFRVLGPLEVRPGGPAIVLIEIPRLEEQHLTAVEDRVMADLMCGRHAEIVGELQALVAEHLCDRGSSAADACAPSLWPSGGSPDDLPIRARRHDGGARQECAVLVIAHRISTVHAAQQVTVLDDGEVVAIGRHDSCARPASTTGVP